MLPKDMIGQYSGSLRLALQNYFKKSLNEKPSRTKISSTILADSTMDLEAMISEHDRILENITQNIIKSHGVNCLLKISLS